MELVEGRATVEDVDEFLDRLSDVGADHGCAVQAFDARYVVGREHLTRAVELANRAFERGENVARDRAVEILLYASGRRQIDRALEMGVSEGEQDVVVVVDCDESERERDDATHDESAAADDVRDLLSPTQTLGVERADEALVTEYFEVGDEERAATDASLADLVAERVALLDVNK